MDQQELLSLRFLDASACLATIFVHWDACFLSETSCLKEGSEEAMGADDLAAFSASSSLESLRLMTCNVPQIQAKSREISEIWGRVTVSEQGPGYDTLLPSK